MTAKDVARIAAKATTTEGEPKIWDAIVATFRELHSTISMPISDALDVIDAMVQCVVDLVDGYGEELLGNKAVSGPGVLGLQPAWPTFREYAIRKLRKTADTMEGS